MKQLFMLILLAAVFMVAPNISLAEGGPEDWREQNAGTPKWYKADWEEVRHGVLHDCSAFIVWSPVKGVAHWCNPIVEGTEPPVVEEKKHPGAGMAPVWFDSDGQPVRDR